MTLGLYGIQSSHLLRVRDSTDSCIESGKGHYEGGVATNTKDSIMCSGEGGFLLTGGH